MSEKKSGGNAFPNASYNMKGGYDLTGGMTLRDYFAASADVKLYTPLENLQRDLGRAPTVRELAEYIAVVRYEEARGMLRARGES